ncbi:MAG: family 43 glycosylhydrolase [Bacteroidales bacterium]|nr:family 43 glycosylhydrolase [Bacteroidales bacterium]
MRRISFLAAVVAAIISALAASAQKYNNPVLHLDYSDPDVCRVGKDYWMTASSFNCFPGLPILHSTDLVNWELVGSALADYPYELAPGDGVWAPSIRYHKGWFYIFVGDPDHGVFMVRSKDPAGTWEEPVWVTEEKGFIDPCPFWDNDGKAYLSHAAAGSRAGLKSVIFVAPMSADGTRLLGPSRIVYDGHRTQPTIEGTKFYKRKGYYYIFAPAGGVSTGWQTVLRSREPFGPYEERIVMAQGGSDINGPHQGAWVDGPGGDWFLHFQDKGAYGRIVHLQPMKWGGDGWPVIGEDPDEDGVGQPVNFHESPRGVAQKGFEPSTAVGPYGLRLDWQYPCVPSPYWHYALPNGDVRLFSVEQGSDYKNLWDCGNVLQQKFPADHFTVTARLVFRPNSQLVERGEQAGMVIMGTDYAGIRVTDRTGGAQMESFVCRGAAEGAPEEIQAISMLPYTEGRQVELGVRLLVVARDTDGPVPDALCMLSYSTDGVNFERAVPFVAKPGKWIGAKWGFFCNRYAPKNDSGSLDVCDLSIACGD